MPGKCPKCGMRILKRTSKNGYTFYACEHLKECGFMTWDVPVADNCVECGQTMFKASGRGARKPFCINEKCKNFLPEDKRGYRRKPKEDGTEKADDNDKSTSDTKSTGESTKKTTARKSSSTKKTTRKTTAKKPSAKKTTAKRKTGTAK